MKNRICVQFSRMSDNAFYMLLVCFNLILLSLCAFCIYLDTAKPTEIFPLIYHQRHIITVYLSSLLISLAGAFLLDYTYTKENIKK